MNKNQITCAGIYEYKSSLGANIIFVNVFQQDDEITVYFPFSGKYVKLKDIPNTAVFSKWV